jgi:hypothetical protein
MQPESPQQLAWQRALDHARLSGIKPTWRVGDYYTVASTRTGEIYTIRRFPIGRYLHYSCSCPAGAALQICKHMAIVAALPHECRLRKEHKRNYTVDQTDPLLEAMGG